MLPFGGAPTVLGHRGLGSGTVNGHRQNTLGSFLAAVTAGVDWVEVDVRRTSDDSLVVCHDPAYEDGVFLVDVPSRTAVLRGTLALDQLLDALPAEIGVDFDLKTSMEDVGAPQPQKTAALVAAAAAREAGRRPVAITSFDPSALLMCCELAPGVPRGLLTWLNFPVGLAVSAAGHLDVQFLAVHEGSLHANPVEPEHLHRPVEYVVDLLDAAGRQLLVWCPGPDALHDLAGAGVAAVCVNDVPGSLARLGRAGPGD